jgi:hypothetical protein
LLWWVILTLDYNIPFILLRDRILKRVITSASFGGVKGVDEVD